MTSRAGERGILQGSHRHLRLGQLNTIAEGSHLEVPAPQGTLGNVCDIHDHQDKGGTSLAAQWLRTRRAMQGTLVESLVGELSSHMPQGNQASVPQPENLCPATTEACTLKPMHHNQSPCTEMQDPASHN